MDNSLVFRIFECGMLGDSELGFATVELSALMIGDEAGQGEFTMEDHFSLFHNNERVGHLLLKSKFESKNTNMKNRRQTVVPFDEND